MKIKHSETFDVMIYSIDQYVKGPSIIVNVFMSVQNIHFKGGEGVPENQCLIVHSFLR